MRRRTSLSGICADRPAFVATWSTRAAGYPETYRARDANGDHRQLAALGYWGYPTDSFRFLSVRVCSCLLSLSRNSTTLQPPLVLASFDVLGSQVRIIPGIHLTALRRSARLRPQYIERSEDQGR